MSITFNLSHFLLDCMSLGKQRACYLDRLPNDILVDQILSSLGIKEILRMRRVSLRARFDVFGSESHL